MEHLIGEISTIAQTLNRNKNQTFDFNLKPKSYIEYKLEEKHFGYYNQLFTLSFGTNHIHLKEIINNFLNLENNWDGYGGFAPSNVVVQNSIQFLNHLQSKLLKDFDFENVFPNPNGTISLEWRKGNNVVGLEIGKEFATYFSVINSTFEKGNEKFFFPMNIMNSDLIQRIESI